MTEAEDRKIRTYTAAHIFLSGEKRIEQLALSVEFSLEELTEIMNSPTWKQAIAFWKQYIYIEIPLPKSYSPETYDHDTDEPMVIKE